MGCHGGHRKHNSHHSHSKHRQSYGSGGHGIGASWLWVLAGVGVVIYFLTR